MGNVNLALVKIDNLNIYDIWFHSLKNQMIPLNEHKKRNFLTKKLPTN